MTSFFKKELIGLEPSSAEQGMERDQFLHFFARLRGSKHTSLGFSIYRTYKMQDLAKNHLEEWGYIRSFLLYTTHRAF